MSSKLAEKLKQYKNYANDCIFFKIVFDKDDLNRNDKNDQEDVTKQEFRPEFTHQIFGDDEEIFGYKGLKVDYYLTPGLLDAYIGLSCKEKISPQRFDGIEPDDVYSAFMQFGCSPKFTRNLDVFFSEKIRADKEFNPFGEKIYEYSRELMGNSSKYEIYKVDSSMDEFGSSKFLDYLMNVQTMLVYYIETASFIDTDDPQWTHFFLYEKKKIGSDFRYVSVGYLSVYNYYAYPDKVRSRVSQVLILPIYQRAGHGAELLQAIYRDACQNSNIIDVTSESPSPEFILLRDYITTKMCSSIGLFRDKSKLKAGFSAEMAQEALKKYKIPKLQSRRVYEILRMSITNEHNEDDWKNYRLDIKKRFYLPFIRKSKYARNGSSIPNREEPTETSTIGFGEKNTKLASINSRFFGNGDEAGTSIGFGSSTKSSNGIKTVTFKKTSMNTSKSTTDDSDEDDDNDDGSGQMNPNLFVSEIERKKYLEEQFQEAVKDYRKIIHKLEHESILPF